VHHQHVEVPGPHQRANGDGRLRGTVQFNGAGRTGRWAGRTFQPHNLPRPSKGFDHDAQLEAVGAIKAGVADLVAPNVMQLTSDLLRGVIVAGRGPQAVRGRPVEHRGRMLAWLAGESWKLQAFRDYDAGSGPDLYVKAYYTSFRVDRRATVDYHARQIGKVMELMLGYEGGVGAFLTGAATYGFDVEDLGVKAFDTIPGHILHEAGEFYDWAVKEKRPTFGLSRQAFVVCDSLKRMWRAAHPNVVSLWRELQRTCIEAVESPGKTLECRRLKVRRDGAWLRIGLPCGRRALCYPQPRVDDRKAVVHGREPVHQAVVAHRHLRRQAGRERHAGRFARCAGRRHGRGRSGGVSRSCSTRTTSW
jgi:DNA polymerase